MNDNFFGIYIQALASGDFGDLMSSMLVSFSSESKLPFSVLDRLVRSNLRTFFVSSSASTIPLVCWFMWHSMVFWLTALFVNAGRLLSHISARGSIFILETMFCSFLPWYVLFNFTYFNSNSISRFELHKHDWTVSVSVLNTFNILIEKTVTYTTYLFLANELVFLLYSIGFLVRNKKHTLNDCTLLDYKEILLYWIYCCCSFVWN